MDWVEYMLNSQSFEWVLKDFSIFPEIWLENIRGGGEGDPSHRENYVWNADLPIAVLFEISSKMKNILEFHEVLKFCLIPIIWEGSG